MDPFPESSVDLSRINALIVSHQRCQIIEVTSALEMSSQRKYDILCAIMHCNAFCDVRDHIFMSPCEKKCCALPGEAIKIFRRVMDKTIESFFICFNKDIELNEVCFGRLLPHRQDTEWKISAESLMTSMSLIEKMQDDNDDITQQFFMEDRPMTTKVSRVSDV